MLLWYVMEIIWCVLSVVVSRLYFMHVIVGGLIVGGGWVHVY